jgi:hypothetical protein
MNVRSSTLFSITAVATLLAPSRMQSPVAELQSASSVVLLPASHRARVTTAVRSASVPFAENTSQFDEGTHTCVRDAHAALVPLVPASDLNAGWEEVGTGSASGGGVSDNTGWSRDPSIAIAPSGTPYIAWEDFGANSTSSGQEPSVGEWNFEIYVRRWNGSSWEEVGLGSATGGGISSSSGWSGTPSIAVAPGGTAFVAWCDNSSANDEIYVRRWNGSSWEEVGVGSATGGGISNNSGGSRFPSLAITSDGTPYVAWYDDSSANDEIYVRRWNGSSWEEVGIGSATGGGISNNNGESGGASVAIAPDNTPYVAWGDESNGNSEIYVRRWNGSSWEEVGIGSATGGGISSNSGDSYDPSIATASDGTPCVAWTGRSTDDDLEIYVRCWNGSSWREAGIGSATGGGISDNASSSWNSSIAIAPTGTPYVAWEDSALGASQIYVRRGPDVVPPIISVDTDSEHRHISRDLCPGAIVLELRAWVSDQGGLDWVRLHYDINGQVQPYVELDSHGETGKLFAYALGPFPQPATVHYHLEAQDMTGNGRRTNLHDLTVGDCPGCTSWEVDFSPRANGFRFQNFSSSRYPGYCTGMSASATDYFEYGQPIPYEYNRWVDWRADPNNLLSCYIKHRHAELQWPLTKYLVGQVKSSPDRPSRNLDEYHAIRGQIRDEGRVALVGLGILKGHSILVYAVTECSDNRIALFAYDSNKVYPVGGAFPGVVSGRLTQSGLVIDSTSTGSYEDIFADFRADALPLPQYPDLSGCNDSNIDQAENEVAAAGYSVNPRSMIESTLAPGESSPTYQFWNDSALSSALFISWPSGRLRVSALRPDGSLFSEEEGSQSPVIVEIPFGQPEGVWSYQITRMDTPSGGGSCPCISLVGYPRSDVYLPLVLRSR